MPATKPLSEVLKQFPDFKPGWSVDINGVTFPTGTVARIWHPTFGSVEHDVVMKPDGTPAFDRPRYHEAPFGQTVLWGKGADGKTRLGFIAQERPHADAPGNKNYGKENQPVLFLTCVMGFKDVMRGKVESDLAAARREVSEEVAKEALISGRSVAQVVLDIGLLTQEQLDDILQPSQLTEPRDLQHLVARL